MENDLLPHERMDVYNVAVELMELTVQISAPKGVADNLDQLRRATSSIVQNCAEACGKDGADRRRFFTIARGSTLERSATLRILLAYDAITADFYELTRQLCIRLYAMLTRLTGH